MTRLIIILATCIAFNPVDLLIRRRMMHKTGPESSAKAVEKHNQDSDRVKECFALYRFKTTHQSSGFMANSAADELYNRLTLHDLQPFKQTVNDIFSVHRPLYCKNQQFEGVSTWVANDASDPLDVVILDAYFGSGEFDGMDDYNMTTTDSPPRSTRPARTTRPSRTTGPTRPPMSTRPARTTRPTRPARTTSATETTKPVSVTLDIKFACKFEWTPAYADKASPAYKALANDVLDWLDEIMATTLETYNMEMDVEINIRPPASQRKRRSTDGTTPEVDIKLILTGKVPADADPSDVGSVVAAQAGDAVTDGVSNYDGDFLDETAVPEVSEPQIVGECTLTAAKQICEVDQQGVKIPACAFPAGAMPYLGDNTSCVGSLIGDDLVFLSETGDCHIDGMSNGTHVSYASSVNWEAGSANEIISRSRMMRVEFECLYQTVFMLSLDHGLTPLLQQLDVNVGSVVGDINLSFGLWESNFFDMPLATDAEINVPEPLFVAAVLDDDSNFNVVFDSCWATPSDDPADVNRYDIITDGCADEDDTLMIFSQGETTSASFSIESFVFQEGMPTDVFFHCRVELCDPVDGTCEPTCSARKRRAADDSSSVQTVVGPVKVLL